MFPWPQLSHKKQQKIKVKIGLENRLSYNICNLPTNCWSVFDHFVGLALKGLK